MPKTQAVRAAGVGADVIPPPFTCEWSPGGLSAAWISLGGELDLAGLPLLELALTQARAAALMVLVDLRHLEFIDCAALSALTAADAEARRTHGTLVVLRGTGQVDRMMAATGMLDRLEVVDPTTRDSTSRPLPRLV